MADGLQHMQGHFSQLPYCSSSISISIPASTSTPYQRRRKGPPERTKRDVTSKPRVKTASVFSPPPRAGWQSTKNGVSQKCAFRTCTVVALSSRTLLFPNASTKNIVPSQKKDQQRARRRHRSPSCHTIVINFSSKFHPTNNDFLFIPLPGSV